MLLIGGNKEIVCLITKGERQRKRAELICFGRKRHYRKDGTCKHTEAVVERIKPWYRSRLTIHRFGVSGA